MTDINFFTQPDGTENLPPAGHERNEELKRRADNLEQIGEEKYADAGTIPPEALQPDHNVQNLIQRSNYLEVGVNHPLYKTKWVNYVNQNGQMVWQAKSDGWAMATAKQFPEAADMSKADGSIRVGDVLLMFIRIDEYFRVEQREKAKRLRQQYGVEADIHDLAAATNRREGREVFKNVQTPEITGGASEEAIQRVTQRSAIHGAAVNTAARHLGNQMKKGTIPGVPIKP